MRNVTSFDALFESEKNLLVACDKGQWLMVGSLCPVSETTENKVRASFIRFLALGGDVANPVHHRGIQISGAWIVGELELTNTKLEGSLVFKNCIFEKTPKLNHMRIDGLLSFRGSKVPSLDAKGLRAESSVTLDDGFESKSLLDFYGAEIKGNLDLDTAKIGCNNEKRRSINADDIVVHKNLNLGEGFKSEGEVRLIGAKIGGDLDCINGKFLYLNHLYALSMDGGIVSGSVFLTEDFECRGKISFIRIRVGHGIYIKNLKQAVSNLDLSDAKVDFISDDLKSWGENINLDGFEYKSFRNTTVSSKDRILWLKTQISQHYGMGIKNCRKKFTSRLVVNFKLLANIKNIFKKTRLIKKLRFRHQFRPQPWHQLINVLHSQGHIESSEDITIAYLDHQLKIGKVRTLQKIFFRRAYRWTTGYGYRLTNLIITMAVTWFLFGWFFWYAALQGVFAPSNPLVFHESRYESCRPSFINGIFISNVVVETNTTKNWYLCDALYGEYTTFSPLAYSLDVLLPFVDLQQEKDWASFIETPTNNFWSELRFWRWNLNHWVRIAFWFEMLMGWLLSLSFVAWVTGYSGKRLDKI